MVSRTDLRTELIVAAGIALSVHGGLEVGARFMAERNVPQSVAERVLLKPWQRRATDIR